MSFTVQPRPGQRASDIQAAASRLALALGVPGLRVTNRGGGWVNIVVVGGRDDHDHGDGGFWDGGPDDRPHKPELRAV
jgi:hypothetical protein